MTKILKIFTLILITTECAVALKCYTCNYQVGTDTDECLNDPASVIGRPITNCNKKYCTITRVETKGKKGYVKSMSRNCVDKPTFHNEVHEDGEFKTYYRSCSTDLCNSGDGVSSAGTITDPNQGAGENMVVRGRNASTRLYNSVFSITIIGLTCFLIKLLN